MQPSDIAVAKALLGSVGRRNMKFSILILCLLSIGFNSAFGQPAVQNILSADLAAPNYKVFEEKVLSFIEEGKKLESAPVNASSKAAADSLYIRLLTLLEVYKNYSPSIDWKFGLWEAYDLLDVLSQKFSLQSRFAPLFVKEVPVTDNKYLKDINLILPSVRGKGLESTQTEAFLQRPFLRAAVQSHFENEEIPQDLAVLAINKERDLASYDVFYHAEATIYALFQDIVTEVLQHIAQSKTESPFYYLRIPQGAGSHEVLAHMLRKGFSIDHDPRIRNVLLSVNLSLFGNTGDLGESTISYFSEGTSINSPYGRNPRPFVAGILADLGLIVDPEFIDELAALYEKYLVSDTGSLLQIFIPKDKVNTYVYLSLPYGVPLNCKALGGNSLWKDCLFYTQELKESITLKDAQGKVIQSYSPQEIDTRTYLDIYRNHPTAIPVDVMDRVQGRILLTDDFLLNPSSGVKIYRYMTINAKKLEDYKRKLRSIVTRMMATAKSKPVTLHIRQDEPLSKQLAITTKREYEKVIESLLKQGQELLMADPTVENSQKAHDLVIRLEALQKVYGPLYGSDIESQQNSLPGFLFYQEDVEKILNALVFKFGLNAISPYDLWKQQKIEEWDLSGNFEDVVKRKLDLLNSIEAFDPMLISQTQETLYSYNLLRELSKLKPALDFSAIDWSWLRLQDYQIWKEAAQESKKNSSIDTLVALLLDSLEFYKSFGDSSKYAQLALYEYNYIRDMLHVPRAQSITQIHVPWLKKIQYKYWKKHSEEFFLKADITLPQQKAILKSLIVLHLKNANNNSFQQREALFNYNFLRELDSLPPVESWTDIDKELLLKEA